MTTEGTDDSGTTGSKVAGAGVGAIAGGWLGSSVGIAALGGAISGALPLAAIGCYVGWKVTKAVQRRRREAATSGRPEGEGNEGEAR